MREENEKEIMRRVLLFLALTTTVSSLPVPPTNMAALKRDLINDIFSQLQSVQGQVQKISEAMQNTGLNTNLVNGGESANTKHVGSDDVGPATDELATELDVNEEANVAQYLFSGDIRVAPNEMKQIMSDYNNKGNKGGKIYDAITEDLKKWPNNTIPYTFDEDFTEKGRTTVAEAIDELTNKTCIRFKRRTSEPDWVEFFHGRGCWSWAGNQGLGRQQISLQEGGCVKKGIAVHEIMHALGFEHEHMRPDRDKYIDIVWENIRPANRIQFDILSNVTFGGKVYDYGSIMHYSDKAFALDRSKKTIIVKQEGAVIGQRKKMSDIDALSVNNLYCNCRKDNDNSTLTIL